MIRCNKCGYVGSYYGPKCPSCKEDFNLTPEEIEEKIEEVNSAEERKDGAERMVREAEQLRFLFRKLASVSALPLPAGTCLAWGRGLGT